MSHRLIFPLLAGIALTMPRAGVAAEGKLPLFVGVGQETVQALPLNEQVVPALDHPQYYVVEPRADERAASPPDWIAQWVVADLAGKGYLATTGAPASLLLKFDWGDVDDQLTHIGRPLQLVDPGWRPVLNWRETNFHRAYAGEASTFCVVTAFDLAASREEPARRVRLWQTKMWIALVRPRPHEKIDIGPLTFKGYLNPTDSPPTPAPAAPASRQKNEVSPATRSVSDDRSRQP